MRPSDLKRLGIAGGDEQRLAGIATGAAEHAGMSREAVWERLQALVEAPANHLGDPHFGELAAAIERRKHEGTFHRPRVAPAGYARWGRDLDQESIRQMENACKLPVSVRGALMPDAHVGYGLPIGGVLATRAAVIPYAVGVDIACRMKLTVLDLPADGWRTQKERLRRSIESETRFGVGASFKDPREHAVMDEDWSVSPITNRNRDKAWHQLGTSGSGNHFVEFGTLTVTDSATGLAAGTYLALLSHSGSRGTGAAVCDHYSRLAMSLHPELPKDLRHLAWLDLSSSAGQEYWHAMQLMGKYAAANHACIHRHIARHLGADVLLDLENHHNFAWEEEHDGEPVIVHRKGATPAAAGVLGVIPGSMAAPGYVVRGKGNPESLDSAAHGAGRRMSRTEAKNTFTWKEAMPRLEAAEVTLLSAGIDEVPMVYKDIDAVMAAQSDLVEVLARFDPKLVKMAPAGERPED